MPAVNIVSGTTTTSAYVAPLTHVTAPLVLTIVFAAFILLLGLLFYVYTTIRKRRATTPIDVEAPAPIQASDTIVSFACAGGPQFVKDGLLSSEEDINQRMVVLVKRMSVESASLSSSESEKKTYTTTSDSFIPYHSPINLENDERAALPVVFVESYTREEASAGDEYDASSDHSVDISMNVQPSLSIDLPSNCLSAGEPALSSFWDCRMNLCLASGLEGKDNEGSLDYKVSTHSCSDGGVIHLPVFDSDLSLGDASQTCGLSSTSGIDIELSGPDKSLVLDRQAPVEEHSRIDATHGPWIEQDCNIYSLATDISHPSLSVRKPRRFTPRPSRLRHVDTIENRPEVDLPVRVPTTPPVSIATSSRLPSKLRPLLLCPKALPPVVNSAPKGKGKKVHGQICETEDKENSSLSNAL